MSEQGENIRRLITLLWLLINLAMIGFLFTSFFIGGQVPLGICITPTPDPVNNATVSPTSARPSLAPTVMPSPAPIAGTWTDVPSKMPTSSVPSQAPTVNLTNSTDDYDQDDPLFYDDGNSGFVMLWSTFLLVSLSIGGTMVLKSCRTPFAIGGFSGVVLVMANLMFILAATSQGELRRRSRLGVNTGADEAILAFSVIEFLLLSAFGTVLVRHRDEVLEIKPGMDEIMDPRQFETNVQGARGI